MLTVLLVLAASVAVHAQDWKSGRATFYGDEEELWSIHRGSCGYGNIDYHRGTGWDVTALADCFPGYSGSCGRCYEVACVKSQFRDGYGATLDRSSSCYDESKSVVVTVTDTCPCNYATNMYSNKRWCCGDMDHFDLSIWAFQKLADVRWGVIALKYRQVACDYRPSGSPSPSSSSSSTNTSQTNSYQQRTQYQQPINNNAYAYSVPNSTLTSSIYENSSIQRVWKDASWYASVIQDSPGYGIQGSGALCAVIQPYGALSMEASAYGQFSRRQSLEFYVRSDNGTPNIEVNLSGPKGSCRPVNIQSLTQTGWVGAYTRYNVYLAMFDFDNPTSMNEMSQFKGCGGNGYWDVNRIEFRNAQRFSQQICVDRVALVG